MKVNKSKFWWNGQLVTRQKTNYIILHHRAGDGDVMSIHEDHLNKGWSGIGYHFYIRKDGTIWQGRPIDKFGSHALDYNGESVGVCFEGNYESETMADVQIKSGKELVSYLKELYPNAVVGYHKEHCATACPGKNFPDEIKKGVTEMTVDEAVEIIQAKIGLEDETIDFLLYYRYGEELVKKIAEAVR